MPDRYAAAIQAGREQYADVLAAVAAAGVDAVFTQTGGMCAALEAVLDDGSTLLVTDEEGSLSWDRADHSGWAVGRYPTPDQDQSEPLALGSTPHGDVGALLPLVSHVLAALPRQPRCEPAAG